MRDNQLAAIFAALVFAALSAAFLAIAPFLLISGLDQFTSASFGIDQFAALLKITFWIAFVPAVVLGLPLFLLLRHIRRVNALSSIAGGFAVGVVFNCATKRTPQSLQKT